MNQVTLLRHSPCQWKETALPENMCLNLLTLDLIESKISMAKPMRSKPLHNLFSDAFNEQYRDRKNWWSKGWQPDLLVALSNQPRELSKQKASSCTWTLLNMTGLATGTHPYEDASHPPTTTKLQLQNCNYNHTMPFSFFFPYAEPLMQLFKSIHWGQDIF